MQKRNIKQVKKELRDQKALIQCAENFNVVGDLTRLKACYLLCHYDGLSVGDIADTIGVSISAVSHTLKRLADQPLVENNMKKFDYQFIIIGGGAAGFAAAIKADEIISVASFIVKRHLKLDDIIENTFIFPTMAESIKWVAQSFRKDVSKLSCCTE